MTEILINSNTRRDQYETAGGEPSVPYTFPIFEATDLQIYETDPNDLLNPVPLEYGTDYTLTDIGAENGGDVVFNPAVYPTGAPAGYLYTVTGDVPEERTSDYQFSGDFKAGDVNEDFDRIVMMVQQLRRDITRGLLTITDPQADAGLFLEVQAALDRANRAVIFSADGISLKAGPLTTDLEEIADYLDDIEAVAAALANIGIVASDLNGPDNIGTVASSIVNVNALGPIAGAIAIAASIKTEIENVSAIAPEVINVSNIRTQVVEVSNISAAVQATAAIDDEIQVVAANIADIQNAEENADRAEAAIAALSGTSTTDLVIGMGAKTFATQAGKFWILGQRLRAANDDGTLIMEGDVTNYVGTSLTLDVDYIEGAGNNADWNIGITGTRGATGAAGSLDFTVLPAETSPDVLDLAVINDVSEAGGVNNKITLGDLFKVINTFTEDTAPDGAADFFSSFDASTGTTKKILLNTIFKLINGLTAETSPDVADVLSLYDASASTADKITLENLFKVINTMTTDGTPAWGADYLVTYDASAALPKKVLLSVMLGLLLSQANDWSGPQRGLFQNLTDGATVTPDFSARNNFRWTIGGNRTLANPTNQSEGQAGVFAIRQNGTGGNLITWGSNYYFPGGTEPQLSTAPNALDLFSYVVESVGVIICTPLAKAHS